MLRGQDLGQLVFAVVQQLTEPEHDLLTLRDRQVPPPRERRLGTRDRPLDLLLTGESDILRRDPQRGIEDRGRAPGRPGGALAIDPMLDDRDPGTTRHRRQVGGGHGSFSLVLLYRRFLSLGMSP